MYFLLYCEYLKVLKEILIFHSLCWQIPGITVEFVHQLISFPVRILNCDTGTVERDGKMGREGTLGVDGGGNKWSFRNSRVLELLCKLSAFLGAGGDPVAVWYHQSVSASSRAHKPQSTVSFPRK